MLEIDIGAALKSLAFSDQITMGRPKGSRNKRTLLKEAEQYVGGKYVDQVLDSLYVLESQAATLAALAAPYRHAKLSAVKLAGDPNNPLRVWDNATADELRAEIMRRLAALSEAGIIDLQGLPALKRQTPN